MIELNSDEIKVLKVMLLQSWNTLGCMSFQEALGMEDDEAWLNKQITSMTEKVGITEQEKY